MDPMTLHTPEAVCVTGEDHDCGATSDELHAEAELTRWIAEHCPQTGHDFYHRTTLCAESSAWQ
ncbi:hypothetical protein [Streptomyces celluloflavus]|uniref:hypothetical protein n=1 Tax=Streptomyces celluloflavus TaxID=58344 RepID=UPI00368E02BA